MLPIQPVTPMNEHINRSAAEADLDRALANDPFLFGLDTTAPEPSPVSPVIDEQQRLAAARAMLQQIETQEGDSPDWPVEPTAGPRHEQARAEEPYTDPLLALAPEPRLHHSAPPVADGSSVIPDGAILAANGQPFRDIDAALFKCRRLTAEAGEPFEVLAVTGGFVLVPAYDAAPTRSPSTPPAPLAPPRTPRAPKPLKNAPAAVANQEVDALTLDDLPEGHAARKYGLPLYQAILSQTRKPLRQAWRSQLPLLIVSAIGVLVFLAPELLVSLAVPPASAERLSGPTFTRGVGYAGLALALFALGKILYIRINFRYFLSANYAKCEAGLIARRSTKLVYGTILATDTHQSVLGRLLNFGTVELSCAGSDGNEILIENVYAPEIVQAVVESRMMAMRGGYS